jgi:hypothetical protein
MGSASVGKAGTSRAGDLLLATVAERGSAAHPYLSVAALAAGPDAGRNLADALHFLCTLHGRYPSAVDLAAERTADAGARGWLRGAVAAFGEERALLARLAAAAGPVPSTPGAADSDAVLQAQRHAIETLARSERRGCALGAALALVLDWAAIRNVLEGAAERFGVAWRQYPLSDAAEIGRLADSLADGSERALLFGAEQVAAQHFGMWDVLEARQQARIGS